MKKSISIGISFLFAVWLTPYTYAQELLNYPLDTVNGEEVYQYRAEKGIGFYRIGVNFNVSQEDIIRLNPQLKERGVHLDELLLIPTGRPVVKPQPGENKDAKKAETAKTEEVEKPEVTEVEKPKITDVEKPKVSISEKAEILKHQNDIKNLNVSKIPLPKEELDTATIVKDPFTGQETTQDSILTSSDSIFADSIIADSIVADSRKTLELALMLPFESQLTKRNANAARMLEFYQGALLALHDLQNDSTLYRLRVFDTERSELRVRALCDSTELDSVRGILGLVYPIQVEWMADWCMVHQVPLLLPFSDNVHLEDRPYVLQFNSTDKQEADSLCQWIISRETPVHCVRIDTREADITSCMRTLRKEMKAQGIESTGLAITDLMNDSADYALDATKENLILLPSDRYQHVQKLIPHLQKLQEDGFQIRLVSQYSWQKEQIDLPQVFVSVFTSKAERETYDNLWAQSYQSEHVSGIPRYDLLGYDLMRTLIEWLNGNKEFYGLQSVIQWEQAGKGGWQNSHAKVQTIE